MTDANGTGVDAARMPQPRRRRGARFMRAWLVRAAATGALLPILATLLLPPVPAAAQTFRQAQWYLGAVRALQAQKVTRGGGVVVGLIDTGVDAGHPDLAGAILPGVSINSTSDGGRSDPDGHGTKMAGVIAARGGGQNHALGMPPAAKILPVAITPSRSSSLAAPIRWAVDHGAKVINMSVGIAREPLAEEQAAVAYALARDVVIVAAAGNKEQGDLSVSSPANIAGVVAVAGTDRSGEAWLGSTHGPEVAIAAPAEDIVNTGARDKTASGYVTGGASSDSTAIVSGVVALIRARYPKLDAANAINRLLRTATDKGDRGRDPQLGFGLVNAQRAVTANVAAVRANPLGAPPQAGDPQAGAAVAGRSPEGGAVDRGPLGSSGARLTLVVAIATLAIIGATGIIAAVVMVSRRGDPLSTGAAQPYRAPATHQPLGYPPRHPYRPVNAAPPGFVAPVAGRSSAPGRPARDYP